MIISNIRKHGCLVGTLFALLLLSVIGLLSLTGGGGLQLLLYPPTKLGLLKSVTAAEVIEIANRPTTQSFAPGDYGLWSQQWVGNNADIRIRAIHSGEFAQLERTERGISTSLFPGELAFEFTIKTADSYEITTNDSLSGTLYITPLYDNRNLRVAALFYLLPIFSTLLLFWLYRWRTDRQQQRQAQARSSQWGSVIQEMKPEDEL